MLLRGVKSLLPRCGVAGCPERANGSTRTLRLGEMVGDELEQAVHLPIPAEMCLTVVEALPAVAAGGHHRVGAGRVHLRHLDAEGPVGDLVGTVVGDHADAAVANSHPGTARQ